MNWIKLGVVMLSYPKEEATRVQKYKFGAKFSPHTIGQSVFFHAEVSATPIGFSH